MSRARTWKALVLISLVCWLDLIPTVLVVPGLNELYVFCPLTMRVVGLLGFLLIAVTSALAPCRRLKTCCVAVALCAAVFASVQYHGVLRRMNFTVLMAWNHGRTPEGFTSPFHGFLLQRRGDARPTFQQAGEAMFACDQSLFTWHALVYDRTGLEEARDLGGGWYDFWQPD